MAVQLPPPSKTGSGLNFPPSKDPSKFSPQCSFLNTVLFHPQAPTSASCPGLPLGASIQAVGDCDAVLLECSTNNGEMSWQNSVAEAIWDETLPEGSCPQLPKSFLGPSLIYLLPALNSELDSRGWQIRSGEG